jgi:hypothetical protein
VKRGRETFQLTDALHSNQRKLTSKMPKKKMEIGKKVAKMILSYP